MDNCNFDYIEKLSQRKEVIIFDRTAQIRSLLNYGLKFEECKDIRVGTVLEKVHKYVKNKKCDLIFGHCQLVAPQEGLNKNESSTDLNELIDEGLSKLNEKLAEIYKDADDDTRRL